MCVCVCVFGDMYRWIWPYISIQYMDGCVYMYECLYTSMYIHTYIYIYIYIYKIMHTHLYIYT